ncbi:FN3 associated domain-containing protein [Xylanibacter muris]|uniref:Chitobiase/beta-hexosaminidase C-terminal domain-containing protein n=1 Tax=Xylanibacter muris TaxID=2736290 RepID=A0ABX2ALF2_9BACT|nr:chitobiase/beta-hexosaminidase C-terminal domain-containing protein [Xylanibacter muris]NPD91723.1 chitobiase/beta-hexosaminidase C-terminal domain-containing protein [Xylanibacter muris]
MWKKGMRLTDQILTLSDKCTEELVSKGLVLGACGRMGLLPCIRNFNLSIDINNNVIDIVSIDCIGLTRNGSLIDIQYDTTYTNSCDTRVTLPLQDTERKYYLCISVLDGCRDTNDGMCEPLYDFLVIEENSPVPDNSLPIAKILFDEYCWRSDENDFVPPCLFLKSHFKYEELAKDFLHTLRELDSNLPQKLYTEKKDAVKIFWPIVQQLMITMENERDMMTPMTLLSYLQKLASAFYCACSLDDYINISDPQQYLSFINTPYNYRNSYETIREGLDLSFTINEKVKSFCAEPVITAEKPFLAAPSIEKGQLRQLIKYGSVQFKITNNAPGSTVYYTIDGSMPNQSSCSGNTIVVESGFADNWHKEPPKNITIKVIAFKDGVFSDVETYNAQIRKGNPFAGKQI